MDILTTERLVLRSACKADLDSLYERVFSVPEVMAQAFSGKPFSKIESADFFVSNFDHDGNGKQLSVLTERGDGAVIGFAGLLKCSILAPGDYEIGFVLGRSYWGKGYATEIGRAQIEYGLGPAGCKRLLALVAPANRASVSVLRKIGMHHHSTVETRHRGTKDVFIVE